MTILVFFWLMWAFVNPCLSLSLASFQSTSATPRTTTQRVSCSGRLSLSATGLGDHALSSAVAAPAAVSSASLKSSRSEFLRRAIVRAMVTTTTVCILTNIHSADAKQEDINHQDNIGVSSWPSSQILLSLEPQKSYSSNARNMERINTGDYSGGSVYNNNPAPLSARRRRAMQGCKIPSARQEASAQLFGVSSNMTMNEKDCNMKVISESPEFMLQAMTSLECPTCPYGVKPTR